MKTKIFGVCLQYPEWANRALVIVLYSRQLLRLRKALKNSVFEDGAMLLIRCRWWMVWCPQANPKALIKPHAVMKLLQGICHVQKMLRLLADVASDVNSRLFQDNIRWRHVGSASHQLSPPSMGSIYLSFADADETKSSNPLRQSRATSQRHLPTRAHIIYTEQHHTEVEFDIGTQRLAC